MGKDYNSYLQFLAAEYNVLYIGKKSKNDFDEALSYFKSSGKMDLEEIGAVNIASTLSKYSIDVVIMDSQENDIVVTRFYDSIRKYNPDIMIMLLLNQKQCKDICNTMLDVDMTVSYPIDMQQFYKRLFVLVSAPYTIKSIGRRDIVLKQTNVVEDSMDKFFDRYEGSSLFLADDLTDIVNDLKGGELSYEILANISEKLDEIASIFSKTKQTADVSPIFLELSKYIKELKLDEIKPENLKGFDYLYEILNDVSVYLLDMFVDRIFKDVYVFEYSLKNNIEFMQNKLSDVQEDEGELDFF